MPAQTASRFRTPNNPGEASVTSFSARKTPAGSQNFWVVALSARPRSRLPDRCYGTRVKRDAPQQFAPAIKTASWPPTTCAFEKATRPDPASAAGSAHVKSPCGATATKREFAEPNSGLGREGIPPRTRIARDRAEPASQTGCKGKESAWRSGTRARAVVSLSLCARAAGAASFPPARPSLYFSEQRRRAKAGKCGARWAGRRTRARPPKEGRGRERSKTTLPRQHPMESRLDPAPSPHVIGWEAPDGRGWPWGWGGQGAGRRRKALAGSDGGG